MATKKGKFITYGGNIFAVVSLILVLLMILFFEFYGFNMSIDNKILKINAPLYGVEFNINDIEEVNLVDNIKIKVRTNGIGMDEYSVGNFNVEGYGKCKLYIYNYVSPYILIKVNGEFIFINAETKEETYNYFNDLEKLIN
ncbi:PH domain-containing protein [Terrisporobacter sp.]|uniref:PH domain-containing protein n=1 Tax=Terrisporobacter sp. TaxID=1965305 RepID=UPI0026734CAB|nr:PH domain-containing protein [Terrisporobacter sp.]MCI6458060.1 PH domain-containing protein [Clostridium sp.]MDY4737443.1 PH domain-containing protein [Terrisporobacter sp.]